MSRWHWAKPGFARREPRENWIHGGVKEGAHGGTMGSPVLDPVGDRVAS